MTAHLLHGIDSRARESWPTGCLHPVDPRCSRPVCRAARRRCWLPTNLDRPGRPRMRKIAIAVLVALSAALAAVPTPAFAGPADVVATEVEFTGAGGVVLHGTV